MTRHVSLDPVGKTRSKPFPSPAASFITLQNEAALCRPSGTAASSANQVSRETYLKLLRQSQAWLTSFRLMLLFSESIWVLCLWLKKKSQMVDCFFLELPLPQTPNQKYHRLTTLEEVTEELEHAWGVTAASHQLRKQRKKKRTKIREIKDLLSFSGSKKGDSFCSHADGSWSSLLSDTSTDLVS